MRLTFLGVRGSTPSPGPDFVRYGGHTSCVAVSAGPGAAPTLVLDAGTGLRSLTPLVDGPAFRGSVLLSHLHWDHVQGIPFFRAGDHPDARVDVFLPAQDGRSGRDLVAQFLSPPAFPITPEGLNGAWTFSAVEPGTFATEGFSVTAAEVAHKGGRTYGYRVGRAGASVAYVPDHVPSEGVDEAALAMLHGVDVLIHDAQFLEPERRMADDFGHATVADSIALARRVGARSLVLFHHGPYRSDAALDAIAESLTGDLPVTVAFESMILDVAGGRS